MTNLFHKSQPESKIFTLIFFFFLGGGGMYFDIKNNSQNWIIQDNT